MHEVTRLNRQCFVRVRQHKCVHVGFRNGQLANSLQHSFRKLFCWLWEDRTFWTKSPLGQLYCWYSTAPKTRCCYSTHLTCYFHLNVWMTDATLCYWNLTIMSVTCEAPYELTSREMKHKNKMLRLYQGHWIGLFMEEKYSSSVM